ncbi:MAG: hypothetical protein Q9173_002564 [Seirophora scorigena]
MSGNQQHRERRRQVNEFYTTSAINKIAYRVDDVSRLLFDKLAHRTSAEGITPFDICHSIKYYAYDAITNVTFGHILGCLEQNSDVNGLMETLAAFLRYGMIVGVIVEWHPLIIRLLQALTPGKNKGLSQLKSIGEDAMKRMYRDPESPAGEKTASGEGHQRHTFVGLLQERHLRDPSTFSRDDVTYHMITNVVAGPDTTSASLNAAIYYLWRNPRVLARLRDELDNWAANQAKRTVASVISMPEAQELPYLQAVLKETMRNFPDFGNNLSRVVPEGGLTIADQFFPGGTVVGMNAFVAHANRDVFGSDADDFRPERWLADQDTVARMEQNFLFVSKNCP